MAKKRVFLLGSTGSIGRQTLEVAAAHSDKVEIVALAAKSNMALLKEQIQLFKPEWAVLYDKKAAKTLRDSLQEPDTEIGGGEEALLELVEKLDYDVLVNAVTGFAGLGPTLKALRRGKAVAMANKEPLVAAGELLAKEAAAKGGKILPVDSEPSAIFQCVQGNRRFLKRILLTASGGPFREWTLEQLRTVTPQMALNHPRWKMGPKITVDSATLMNKGLEVIEAHYLFGVDFSCIEVLIHPQSLVHSLVEFQDGSILGQLALPDMRLPIQYALSFPERWDSPWPGLNLTEAGKLTFEVPKRDLFPCLDLAYAAGRKGGTMPAVLSAADEVAVELFLQEKIPFHYIPKAVEEVMENHDCIKQPTLEELLRADEWARRWVREKYGRQ